MPIDTTTSTVAAPATFITGFAKTLCVDIDADRFADRLGTTINHPAFILGHVAYYAGYCVHLLGGEINLTEEEAEQRWNTCMVDYWTKEALKDAPMSVVKVQALALLKYMCFENCWAAR